MQEGMARAAAALDERHGIAGGLTFADMYGGIVAVLSHRGASAIVAVQGAQVLSYKTPECGEVLWLSPQTRLGTGKAVRGGIPVCWPWFGPHPDGGGRPAHGFVRTRPWTVVEGSARHVGVALRLALAPQDLPDARWRNDVGVEIEVQLGSHLDVALSTLNHGPEPVTITQALHTYLRAGRIDAVEIAGLQDKPFIDQLAPGALRREAGLLRIAGETDRIYQESEGPVTVFDTALGRRIVISKSNSRSTVVWNPWVEKAARLGDMGEDGYRHMVCIETANAGEDILTVPAQAVRRLATAITCARMDPGG